MKRFIKEQPEHKPLLGMAGAFIFLVSLIPIPAYMGTCSHPCGTPLAGILLGPGIGAALSELSLVLQALLFAHGGFATMGANILSLGLGGAGGGWLFFRLGRKMGLPLLVAAGLSGLLGDILTYLISGSFLGEHLAFFAPQPQYSFGGYLAVIMAAYVPVQLPIALGEIAVTGIAVRSIGRQRPEVLEALRVVRVAGVELDARSSREVYRTVGLLFQDPQDQLFCNSVGEDVAYGPNNLGLSKAEVVERVALALNITEVRHLEQRPIHHLSGGELKRVALAGIVAMQNSLQEIKGESCVIRQNI